MADKGKRNQENTKLNRVNAAQDVERANKVARESKERFLKVFFNKRKEYARRGEFKANLLEDFFRDLINEDREQWRQEREKMIAANDSGAEYSIKDLIDVTKPIEDNINKISTTIAIYLEGIAAESPDGKFMPEAIQKMLKSQFAKASQIEKVVRKAPELLKAFQWALRGDSKDKGGQRSVDSSEAQAFKDVENGLAQGEDKRSVCWSIIGFMNSARRIKFTKQYAQKQNMDSSALMAFLEEGNLIGVFSPDEMAKLIESHQKDDKTKEVLAKMKQNKNQYGITWKLQNDFYQVGQQMMRASYGSVNQAADLFTPKNLGMLLGYTVAGATIGANVLANAFVSGRLKDPTKLLEMATNKYILTSVAAIEILGAVGSKESIADKFKGNETKEKEEVKAAKKNIKLVLKSNPDWHPFLEKSDYFGMKAMWEYVVFISEKDNYLPKQLLKTDAFRLWVNKMSEGKKDGPKYAALAKRFDKLDPKDSEFARIGRAFHVMRIGKMDAKRKYKDATKNA